MTPEQFCYWLQGYFELHDEGRGWSRVEHIIRDHLQEVFKKETPVRDFKNPLGPVTPYNAPEVSMPKVGRDGTDPYDPGRTFIC